MSYIPIDRKDALLNFKYSGGTDSITYQYLWSPFAEYLLQFVPTWVAPNLITFSALVMLAVANVIFMLPDDNDVIPNWKLVMMAVTILIYQHMDNLDGKQARKTKSSSPLGMLFDHGSDAVTAFFLGIQVLKILHAPLWLQLFAPYIFVMSTYFCAMWSQYCVGYFKLGRINPVDEGLPIYAISCLVGTQFDLAKLRQQHIIGSYSEEILYSLMILLVAQVIYMTKDILKKRIVPVGQFIFMPVLYFAAGLSMYIVYIAVPQLNGPIFYPFYYSIMFFWSRSMINIQLYHITKQKYRVFNQGTISFITFCIIYFLFNSYFTFNHSYYFIVMCIIQGIIFFEFVIRVLNQGAEMLNIRIFSLKVCGKTS